MTLRNERIYLEKQKKLDETCFFTIRKKIGFLEERLKNTLHWHDYYELELIVGGNGIHWINGESHPLHRGCAYLLTPKDFHTVTEDQTAPLLLYNINFSEQLLPASLQQHPERLDALFSISFDESATARLADIADSLLWEFQNQAPNRQEMIVALFTQLLVEFTRQSLKQSNHATLEFEKPQLPVNRVIAHMKLHFRDPLTLADYARMVYLTPNYLGELFHRTTGLSFQQYLRKLRFEYAIHLLCASDISVEEISRLSGFPNASYFISQFRTQYGTTPHQYRRLHRESQNFSH